MSKKTSSGYLVWSNIPQGKIGSIEFRGSERPFFDRKNVGDIVPVVGCGVIGEGVEADVNVLFRASDLKVLRRCKLQLSKEMNKRITQNVANYLAKPEHHAVSAFIEGTASGVQSSSFRRHSVRPNSIFQTSQPMMKSTVLPHLVQTIRLGFSYSCYFPPIRFGFGRIEGWQQVEPSPKQQCTTIESHSLRHLPLRRNWK